MPSISIIILFTHVDSFFFSSTQTKTHSPHPNKSPTLLSPNTKFRKIYLKQNSNKNAWKQAKYEKSPMPKRDWNRLLKRLTFIQPSRIDLLAFAITTHWIMFHTGRGRHNMLLCILHKGYNFVAAGREGTRNYFCSVLCVCPRERIQSWKTTTTTKKWREKKHDSSDFEMKEMLFCCTFYGTQAVSEKD